ncbi:hypothetical protein A2572_01785 [Candidatus Collierbacteria bacterium RIFOXYD1_FULL_40_9]|uniref:Uncharacterized protein n=1 Tax=Candidatus Collierbacteria bacterium RIFOXYD1_FULL_40_9 TaxID=1817731 RepID=A0A1F5FUY1_9BACT|nr:MAG: hypothetical protein A2572_01785 [Candidatus Collierbacteria bacterium RIFOXYD1_FULL_40_9]
MKISRKQIEFTVYELLEKLLDSLLSGYTIDSFDYVEGEPEKFMVMLGSSDVAVVTFDGETFSFDFSAGTKGDDLERLLKQKYPDELLWLVLYPLHSAWSYSGEPKPDSGQALGEIDDIAFKSGDQPQLVAFRSSEWPSKVLKAKHCWMIHGDNKGTCYLGNADGGDQLFVLTNEE